LKGSDRVLQNATGMVGVLSKAASASKLELELELGRVAVEMSGNCLT
jgi:hypothetical protein